MLMMVGAGDEKGEQVVKGRWCCWNRSWLWEGENEVAQPEERRWQDDAELWWRPRRPRGKIVSVARKGAAGHEPKMVLLSSWKREMILILRQRQGRRQWEMIDGDGKDETERWREEVKLIGNAGNGRSKKKMMLRVAMDGEAFWWRRKERRQGMERRCTPEKERKKMVYVPL